jgi:hypothetical protein
MKMIRRFVQVNIGSVAKAICRQSPTTALLEWRKGIAASARAGVRNAG